MNKPLQGITVIAASLAEAGPVTSEMLGMLGAEVWHIERPINGPTARYTGSLIRMANKKSITLDTKTEEGKAILWRLIEKADVFMENFAPGAWDRMGFSYEEMAKRKPDIIYCSVKGFAKDSKWGKCITYDPVAVASGGGAALCGYEDLDPMMCGINVADSGAAIHNAMGIVAACLYKKLTGKGQYIEAPMQNAVTVECRDALAQYYEVGEKNPRRAGNSYRGTKPTAPHNVYPVQGTDPIGNHIAIACSADPDSQDFTNLCKAIGREDLLADPRFETPELRFKYRHDLDFEISKWTYRHTKEEATAILAGQYGVPAAPVNGPRDMCADDQIVGSILQDMPDSRIGHLRMPIIPTKMKGYKIRAITCGEHGDANRDVYCGVLGMTEAELKDLAARKII